MSKTLTAHPPKGLSDRFGQPDSKRHSPTTGVVAQLQPLVMMHESGQTVADCCYS